MTSILMTSDCIVGGNFSIHARNKLLTRNVVPGTTSTIRIVRTKGCIKLHEPKNNYFWANLFWQFSLPPRWSHQGAFGGFLKVSETVEHAICKLLFTIASTISNFLTKNSVFAVFRSLCNAVAIGDTGRLILNRSDLYGYQRIS